MDPKLSRFDVFKSPESRRTMRPQSKYGDKQIQSLLQYKSEQMRQSLPVKINKLEAGAKNISQAQLRSTLSINKFSYSHSIQLIENVHENQLDYRVLKLLKPKNNRDIFNIQQKLEELKQQHSNHQEVQTHHHIMRDEEPIRHNVRLRFSNTFVKSQYKANLLIYKKISDVPAQLNLINQQEMKKKYKLNYNDIQQPVEPSEKATTQTQGFFKSQRSQLNLKEFDRKGSSPYKKTQSAVQDTLHQNDESDISHPKVYKQ